MRLKGLYILISYLAHCTICFSQGQTAALSRNEIFDRMEARAKSLAQRMDEMSGNSNRVSSPAPRATDSNPSSFSPPPPSSEPIIEGGGASPIVNPFHSESQIVESTDGFSNEVDDNMDYLQIESAQEILGDYYILPSFGFVLSSETTVQILNQASMTDESYDLDNEIGFTVGMKAGLRLDKFFAELGVKYLNLEYNTHSSYNNKPILGNGSLSVLNLNARLGYSYSITESLFINGSGGLGLSSRKNFLQQNVTVPDEFSSSETVLSYDLAFSIAYHLAESYQVSLGYNYMNVAKISQFDALDLHYFELGLGLNF